MENFIFDTEITPENYDKVIKYVTEKYHPANIRYWIDNTNIFLQHGCNHFPIILEHGINYNFYHSAYDTIDNYIKRGYKLIPLFNKINFKLL